MLGPREQLPHLHGARPDAERWADHLAGRSAQGDYLDLEVQGSTLLLQPVTVVDRAEADRQLDTIPSRVTYTGPEPEPSEDKVIDMVVEEIRAVRNQHAKSRS